MGSTTIEWTDATWNPVTGCTKVSAGCKNCYAERVFPRAYGGMCVCGHKEEAHDHNDFSVGQGIPATCFHEGCNCERFKQRQFADVRTHHDRLTQPLHWRKPRRVFVNSMSDLFHEDVPMGFVMQTLAISAMTPQHDYQILTKRPQRMREMLTSAGVQKWVLDSMEALAKDRLSRSEWWHDPTYTWPLPNVWLGTSLENQPTADARLPHLLQTPAAVRFVSAEPLLGPIRFADVPGFNLCGQRGQDLLRNFWVIVGGESGPGARPMHPDWARSIRDQCQAAGVAFFFKQWGEWAPGEMVRYNRKYPTMTYFNDWRPCPDDWVEEADNGPIMYRVGKQAAGRLLDGRTWDEFPEVRA